jgi:HD-GYP domain-containing protein (c-di-GMP phosphodiesterase class II)
MELMRSHPVVGARLVESAPGMREVSEWIGAHHERPDGRGYPELLSSEELAIPPRILAVADAYHALRAERPYRPAFSADETMAMIELGAGRQFDARVVEALPEALEAAVAETAALDGADAAG